MIWGDFSDFEEIRLGSANKIGAGSISVLTDRVCKHMACEAETLAELVSEHLIGRTIRCKSMSFRVKNLLYHSFGVFERTFTTL